MRAALLPLLLPVVCQGTNLISLANNNKDSSKYEIDTVDPVTGKFTTLFDHGVSISPYCSTLRDNGTVVYCNTMVTPPYWTSELVTVDLSTGKVQRGPRDTGLLFTNLGYDKVTKQTFAIRTSANTNPNLPMTAHNDLQTSQAPLPYTIYELLPTQDLRQVAQIPRVSYVSAYSSPKHLFFLDGGRVGTYVQNVFTVGTVGKQAGKTIYNVKVDMAITALLYDDTFGVLYAWGFDPTCAAMLVSLDYTTGEILKTFFKSTTISATPRDWIVPTCIDKAGSTIYSVLVQNPSNTTVIHTLDLSSGNASQAPAGRLSIMTMDCQ